MFSVVLINNCRAFGLRPSVLSRAAPANVGLGRRRFSEEQSGKYCCDINAVKTANRTIRSHIKRTPMFTSTFFDAKTGRRLFFKAENLQTTGSFKVRGALNAVLKLQKNSTQPKCLLTHSSGNHGQAVARAAQIIGVPCYVVMPEGSSQCKVDAVKQYGGKVVYCPATQKGRSEVSARIIQEHSAVFIHPSQNPDVIAGQGTLGLEVLEQNHYIDTIIAPVGGGGMISGIAIAAKALKPSVKVIAAEPAIADDCYQSKQRGQLTKLTNYPSTIADGARINIGQLTWPIIRDMVDDVITVSEDEIKEATQMVWERLKLVIEPTSGVAVAAVLSEKFKKCPGENVGVILCGGNVDLSSLLIYFN